MKDVLDTAAAFRPQTFGDWLALAPLAAIVLVLVGFAVWSVSA